jgi:hypothetical protein
MSKIVTLYSYLALNELGIALDDKDPIGKDDISFIVFAASQIPQSQQEVDDINPAELASICLKAFQRAVTLHTRATIWMGHKRTELQAEYGSFVASSNIQVTVRKEAAKSQKEYVEKSKEFEKANAYVEFYKNMLLNLQMGHYWAKSKEMNNNKEFNLSGYEPIEVPKMKGDFTHDVTKNNVTNSNESSSEAVVDETL